MTVRPDPDLLWLFGWVLGLLVAGSLAGLALRHAARGDSMRATVANLDARVRAWWVMSAVFALTLLLGPRGSVALFAALSFLALRGFVTLTPTRPGAHRTLFWIFFVFTPLQYGFVAARWYGMFAILIPVYAFVFAATRIAIAGDTERFLERTAKIHWGLMVCVYCVSYAPALLMLDIPGYEGQNAKLLLFLVLVDLLSDVFQYVWGKLAGRHRIAPGVSPNKTWEGLSAAERSDRLALLPVDARQTAAPAVVGCATPWGPPAPRTS